MKTTSLGQFLWGIGEVKSYLESQGDMVRSIPNGLEITRFLGDSSRPTEIVVLSWEREQGVARFVCGGGIPNIDEELFPAIEGAFAKLNAELAMPALTFSDGAYGALTYAFFNHDGSISSRSVESCVRLAIDTLTVGEKRIRAAIHEA